MRAPSIWCGLDRVTMPDRTEVAVNPPPVLLCSMAEAVAEWVRTDAGPAAIELGAPLAAITEVDSYSMPRPQQHRRRQAIGTRQGQCSGRQRRSGSRNGGTCSN